MSLFQIIVTRLYLPITYLRNALINAVRRITYEIVDSRCFKWVMADSYINRYVIATMTLYVRQVNERKGENRP